jgi:hypothetical protein
MISSFFSPSFLTRQIRFMKYQKVQDAAFFLPILSISIGMMPNPERIAMAAKLQMIPNVRMQNVASPKIFQR